MGGDRVTHPPTGLIMIKVAYPDTSVIQEKMGMILGCGASTKQNELMSDLTLKNYLPKWKGIEAQIEIEFSLSIYHLSIISINQSICYPSYLSIYYLPTYLFIYHPSTISFFFLYQSTFLSSTSISIIYLSIRT